MSFQSSNIASLSVSGKYFNATISFSKYYIYDMQQPYTKSLYQYQAVIALGANIVSRFGSPDISIRAATNRIAGAVGAITGKSRLFLTPCFPANAGPDYVNAVIIVETLLTASKVLEKLHFIEAEFGRERTKRWGSRVLDLDLICLGATVRPDEATYMTWRHKMPELQKTQSPSQLILPHPRMHERAFVLVPMSEVAADWMHPVLQKTTSQLLGELDPQAVAEVVPLNTKEAHP